MNEDEQIEIAKHVHHNFEWKWLNEEEEVTEKGKKGKSKTSKMGEMDIRRFPVLLTDGQEFGIRKIKDTEGLEEPDDF